MNNIKYIENVLNKYEELFFDEGLKKKLLEKLNEHYENRHYHSLTHIVNCLDTLDKIINSENNAIQKHDQEALVCAILFHDIIYGENKDVSDERMSALLFEEFMSPYVKNQDLIAKVKELILSTEHLRESFTPSYVAQELIDLMADIDLCILSENEETYDIYTKNVRKEYSHVNELDFNKGRLKVLINLEHKAKERNLYKTEYFKHRNLKALENIQNEMNTLKIKINLLDKKPQI